MDQYTATEVIPEDFFGIYKDSRKNPVFWNSLEKLNLWLLADGLHRIMMTKRIIENNKRQIASSTHSSCQSCQGKQQQKQKKLREVSTSQALSKDELQISDKEAHFLYLWILPYGMLL